MGMGIIVAVFSYVRRIVWLRDILQKLLNKHFNELKQLKYTLLKSHSPFPTQYTSDLKSLPWLGCGGGARL